MYELVFIFVTVLPVSSSDFLLWMLDAWIPGAGGAAARISAFAFAALAIALAAQTDARHWSTDDQRGGPAQWSVSNEEATQFCVEDERGG